MSPAHPGRPGAPELSSSTRFPALDVARGVAILGTLATNIWLFTDPEGFVGFVGPSGADEMHPAWQAVGSIAQQLPNGKFLGLLTIVFGVGLELQRRSALSRGASWPGSYPLRAGLLFVEGLLHFLLIAEFDVLMGYAFTAVVVAYLLLSSDRAQRTWWWVAIGVHLTALTVVGTALALLPVLLREEDMGSPEPLDPNPYADGSFADLVAFRLDNVLLFRVETVFIFALSVALFLLGARLLRAGLLEAAGASLRRRLMLLGGVALLVDLPLGVLGGDAGFAVSRYGTAPVVALGLFALVISWGQHRPRAGAARRRLAEVGRTALSCYVLQNVVASVLCYGWGFGIAAVLPEASRVPATIVIYLTVAAVVVAAAHLWLRRFDRGPLEQLMSRGFAAAARRPRRP